MSSPTVSGCLLQKLIPELRNPRYRRTYFEGRNGCLSQALAGEPIDVVPLCSHNATWQSFYRQGWQSVTEQDIRLAKTVGMSAEAARQKSNNSCRSRMLTNLKQLISNPASGHLSTSDTVVMGAFIASTAVLLWFAWLGKMDEWLYIGYLSAWVFNTQASKLASIKRDREVTPND